jgi:hypothetical protein
VGGAVLHLPWLSGLFITRSTLLLMVNCSGLPEAMSNQGVIKLLKRISAF